MIFYKIEQNLTQCMKVDGYTGDLVSLVSEKEFKQMIKNEIIDENIAPKYKNAKCCKASVRRDSISGVMSCWNFSALVVSILPLSTTRVFPDIVLMITSIYLY